MKEAECKQKFSSCIKYYNKYTTLIILYILYNISEVD